MPIDQHSTDTVVQHLSPQITHKQKRYIGPCYSKCRPYTNGTDVCLSMLCNKCSKIQQGKQQMCYLSFCESESGTGTLSVSSLSLFEVCNQHIRRSCSHFAAPSLLHAHSQRRSQWADLAPCKLLSRDISSLSWRSHNSTPHSLADASPLSKQKNVPKTVNSLFVVLPQN